MSDSGGGADKNIYPVRRWHETFRIKRLRTRRSAREGFFGIHAILRDATHFPFPEASLHLKKGDVGSSASVPHGTWSAADPDAAQNSFVVSFFAHPAHWGPAWPELSTVTVSPVPPCDGARRQAF